MFDRKLVKTRKRNIGSFLAMMLCTIVIVSTVGNFFVTRDAFAQEQEQLQTDQASVILYNSPWSNNLLTFSANGAHHDTHTSTTNIYRFKKP